MLIYIFIFLGLATMFIVTAPQKAMTSFNQSKSRVVIFNDDQNTDIVKGFKDYLSKNAELVTLPDQKEKIQDALFYESVQYVVRIPKGFTDEFLSGKNPKLEVTSVPQSTDGKYTGMMIDRYFNVARLFVSGGSNLTQQQITDQTAESLKSTTPVNMKSYGSVQSDYSSENSYFNYIAYVLFAVLILGVTSILIAFNETDLRRRNLCAPIRISNFNFQLLLANLVFSILCWALMIGMGFIFYGSKLYTQTGFYLCLNSFVFMLDCLSISFIIGLLIKNKQTQSAIANVFSLGMCFLSGVFVPQELLSDSVLRVSSFGPTYWFVKANNQISNLSSFTSSNMSPIVNEMFIELGFAVAIFAVGLVISKQKSTSDN